LKDKGENMANELARAVGFSIIGDGVSNTFSVDIRDAGTLGNPSVPITQPAVGVAQDGGPFGNIIVGGPTPLPSTVAAVSRYTLTLTFSAPLQVALYQAQVGLFF
jgi:hypothetical protein